jgi:uncharacterized protein (DUF488 family)
LHVIYTIGTSNRTEAEFFDTLAARGVRCIVDIRSKPWSRLPQFRKARFEATAQLRGLKYVWEGDVLGGLNEIATHDPKFLIALDRLLEFDAKMPTAIFCSEGAPTECHRSWKVGAALLVHRGVVARNILRDGLEEDVTRTLLRTKPIDVPVCLRDQALKLSMKVAIA